MCRTHFSEKYNKHDIQSELTALLLIIFWFYGRQLLEPIIKNAADLTSKSDIKIRYPIMQFEKSEVLGSLKELGLYDLCWWCETPKQSGETCGSCHPCITHNKVQKDLWWETP